MNYFDDDLKKIGYLENEEEQYYDDTNYDDTLITGFKKEKLKLNFIFFIIVLNYIVGIVTNIFFNKEIEILTIFFVIVFMDFYVLLRMGFFIARFINLIIALLMLFSNIKNIFDYLDIILEFPSIYYIYIIQSIFSVLFLFFSIFWIKTIVFNDRVSEYLNYLRDKNLNL